MSTEHTWNILNVEERNSKALHLHILQSCAHFSIFYRVVHFINSTRNNRYNIAQFAIPSILIQGREKRHTDVWDIHK